MALAAAVLAAALAVALTGTVLHAGEPGHAITVLNPKSYPLVGGTWAVNLDVAGGGDLAVSAVGSGVGGTDTMFGRDIEFAGMHHHDSGTSLAPSSVGDDGILRFEDVREGRWTFDVNVLTAGPHHLRFDLGGDRAYASNTASLADVTSRTPDGRYLPGDTVEVLVNFTEPVTLGAFGIRDGGGDAAGGTFEELLGAISIATARIGGSHYALVASNGDDGVQIINITDPASPAAVANLTDGATYPELKGPNSITTARIGDSHYALVASFWDDGVQIINITDPGNPSPVANLTDGAAYPELKGPVSITTAQIGDSHYALVAARLDNGVQIINITDPGNPSPVAALTDGAAYPELNGPYSITTARIGDSHYALVASGDDDGVQIINITDPGNPSPVANLTDGADYPELLGAFWITAAQIGDSHYALVASYNDDGVQIINITDPGNPSPVASLTNGTAYPKLGGPYSITTTRIGDSHYALVASYNDDGVQIINITDPGNPSPVASLTNGTTYPELSGPNSITTARIGDSHYALVASGNDAGSVQIIDITDPAHPHNPLLPYVELDLAGDRRAAYAGQAHGGRALVFEYAVRDGDLTSDLAYNGTGALRLGHGTLADADDSFDLSNATLPAPGAPHSLSHNKQIVLGNAPPTVDAGPAQTADEGQTVTLAGTATDPDQIDTLTYSWSQTSPASPAVSFDSPNSLSTNFTAPQVAATTAFIFTLTVNDGTVEVSDTLQVTITDSPNSPPEVGAGDDQEVVEGATVSLSGTVSDDDPEDDLTYSWTHDDALSITITGSDSLSASFTAPNVAANTTITVTLTVNDGTVDVSDTLQVTITDSPNTPPTVDAGPAQAVNEGAPVTLTGTATDHDQADTLTYSWSQTSPTNPALTLSSPTSLTTTFTAPPVTADTAFTFTLSVTDGTDTSTDTVTVTVEARSDKAGSRSKTWTVDDMVGIMGGKGQHDLELISRCDEGTDPISASTELHLLGLLGQASYGTFNVDMETTWVWIIEAYRLAYHYLDTGKDVISEDVYEDGITLDQYIDAAPGDVFEYPDGNYTKAQLGSMTAWSASIDWAGDGSCSLDFRQETWAP